MHFMHNKWAHAHLLCFITYLQKLLPFVISILQNSSFLHFLRKFFEIFSVIWYIYVQTNLLTYSIAHIMNQTNQKNTWSRNDATILSAMEFLTCKQQLAYSWDDPHAPYVNLREDAITYLQERLNMTRLQVQIVTCILYHAARSSGQN